MEPRVLLLLACFNLSIKMLTYILVTHIRSESDKLLRCHLPSRIVEWAATSVCKVLSCQPDGVREQKAGLLRGKPTTT